MFTIDNDKPQALGALIRREVAKPQPKPVEIKPGLTMVGGKMSFDPEKSANPPAPKEDGFDFWAGANCMFVMCEAVSAVSSGTLVYIGGGGTYTIVA